MTVPVIFPICQCSAKTDNQVNSEYVIPFGKEADPA